MAGYLTSAQLTRMRETVTRALPDLCTNSRTGETHPVLVYPDGREHPIDGTSPLIRARRWVLELPQGVDVARYDTLTVVTMGAYWVAEVKAPLSYALNTEVLCWQTTDAAGVAVDVVAPNATAKQYRAGSQVGSSRRVRFMPASPSDVNPMGQKLPDQAVTSATDTGWHLNDVLELTALDGFTGVPHPHRFRVQAPIWRAEPPAFIVLPLTGEAGSWEA